MRGTSTGSTCSRTSGGGGSGRFHHELIRALASGVPAPPGSAPIRAGGLSLASNGPPWLGGGGRGRAPRRRREPGAPGRGGAHVERAGDHEERGGPEEDREGGTPRREERGDPAASGDLPRRAGRSRAERDEPQGDGREDPVVRDRKSTRLNSSHQKISYA